MRETPDGSRRVSRRRVLLATAATGNVVLAGCLGDDSANDAPGDDPDDDDDDDPPEEPSRPVSGTTADALAPLEAAMHEYMDGSEIGAGALVVVHEGDVLVERGFGWADRERTETVDPDGVYRIGSLSKRFTDDAVGRLVEAGDLSLDDRVHPLVAVDPPNGTLADERFEDVTVRHLLNHEGGWDRFQHANPLFDPLVVSDRFGLGRRPERDDFIRWVLDTPLQFGPGERVAYSNLGYLLLGDVIESATGRSYQSFLAETLLDGPGIETVEIGRTRPANRHPDEVWYDDREQCEDVFDPNGEGSCAAVGMVVEAFEAAGGHVADAVSLAWAFEAVDHTYISPNLGEDVGWRDGPPEGPYVGSTYGSYAYARRPTPETTVVALFNGRHLDPDVRQSIIFELEAAYEEVTWP